MVIACLIAVKLLAGGKRWALGNELPGAPAMSGFGFFIGLSSSFMGVAGGSLVAMVLTLYGKQIHNTVATGAGVGVPITLAAASAMFLPVYRIRHYCRRYRSASYP